MEQDANGATWWHSSRYARPDDLAEDGVVVEREENDADEELDVLSPKTVRGVRFP